MQDQDSPVTEAPHGVILLDKPPGPTSFKMVSLVRRALKIKKVGHAGTLDPFASGLLVICVGRPATKMISRFMAGEKEYEARLRLGIETDSQDTEGKIIREQSVGDFSQDLIDDTLAAFAGEIMQQPPAFSALKHKGKPLYYYARKGIKVVKEPRKVIIREIDCLARTADTMDIRVVCGKGTYIRTLAADIGTALGCGAHLIGLRRLRSGNFRVADAVSGQQLFADAGAGEILRKEMMPVAEALCRNQKTEDGSQVTEIG
jgi:tRNA pseudouridine55 synthase